MKSIALWIAWPSFLMAGVLEMLLFSSVDPHDMRGFGGVLADMSAAGLQTLVFFCFWIVTAMASALTLLLALPEPESADRERRRP